MSASHPSPDAPRCTICGKAATRQDIDGEWWPPCPHAMKFGIHTLAARSSAPTFPPKPLLTDANAADRCVHGTHPPAICEHCQRQATTRAAPSEGPAVDLDEALKRVDVSGLFDDPPALPVPAQEARTAELIAWMAERSKMCDDALALNVLSDGTRVEAIALKAVYEDTIARLRSHSEIPEAPCPKCAQREARMFPIMDGPDVPWSLLEPHEKHAMKNHGQTLERLAERGGLAAVEALQILDAKPFGRVKLPVDYANRILAARVRSLRSADSSGSDRPAAPTVPETSDD